MSPPRATARGTQRRITRRLPSKDELLAERCRRKLGRFTREAWPILEPATPFVHGWHIDCICEHLEAVSAGELRRLVINVPPRTAKSSLVCKLWPAWEWLTDPSVRWMFASYSSYLSLRDSVHCRRLVQSAGGNADGRLFERVGYQGVLRLLGRDWQLTGDQNAKEKFETTESGSRLATSVGARATGEGGERIVIDDPLDPEQARSDKERERANLWWDETMSMRFNSARSSAVLVMQRLNERDLTGHLLEQGGWHHLCLPAEYEPRHPFVTPAHVTLPALSHNVQADDGTVETITTPGGRVLSGDPRTEPGELLEPVRISGEVLAERLRTLRAYGFAGQYQQRPAPAEGGIIKRHWWRAYTTMPPVLNTALLSWDLTFGSVPAPEHNGRKRRDNSGSWNVGQCWGVVGPNAYLLDETRGRWDFVDLLEEMRAFAAKWPQARPILIENKAAGAPAIATLRREIPGLVAIDPTKDKVARAESVTPFIEGGNAYLPEWALGDPRRRDGEWVSEQASFPNGASNDRVDAMSQALSRIYLHASAAKGAMAQPGPGERNGETRLTVEQLRTLPM